MKYCPYCCRKIRQKLHSYSSGDGCLTLTWREVTRESPSTGRIVTKQDAIRHLAAKENQLAKRNWLPVLINGRWVLARHVKRIGPNRLRISGHSYDYKINTKYFKSAEEANLTTTFKIRANGKMNAIEMKNLSLRMVIRFFLNHEEILKPQFKDHKVIKGEV